MTELKPIGIAIGKLFDERIPSRGLRIDSCGLAPEIKSQLLFRTYESAEIRAVCRHLRRDVDVIELGASIGVLSCHIRRKLATDRYIYCIEADPELMNSIERNLQANGLNWRITILNRAISNTAGAQNFIRGDTNLSGHATQLSPNGTTTVEGVTLRDLIAQFGIGEYALVCDIEGFEVELVAGEFAALRKCRQIIIELHQCEDRNFERLIGQLRTSHGFSLQAQYGNVCVLERSAHAYEQNVRTSMQTA